MNHAFTTPSFHNRQLKENKQKMGTLKRNQQTEKTKNAQMLEEARKRETEVSDDASQLKVGVALRHSGIHVVHILAIPRQALLGQ